MPTSAMAPKSRSPMAITNLKNQTIKLVDRSHRSAL
jgi:hypothetical protein